MIGQIIYLFENAQSPAIARYIYKIRIDVYVVKHSFEDIDYLVRSISQGYKALLLNIGSGMIQNKTTFYNK